MPVLTLHSTPTRTHRTTPLPHTSRDPDVPFTSIARRCWGLLPKLKLKDPGFDTPIFFDCAITAHRENQRLPKLGQCGGLLWSLTTL